MKNPKNSSPLPQAFLDNISRMQAAHPNWNEADQLVWLINNTRPWGSISARDLLAILRSQEVPKNAGGHHEA